MATAMPPDRIAPSTTACVVGASILAGVVGYFIGQGAWLFSYSSKSKSRSRGSQEKRDVQDVSDKDDWESDDDEADEDGGELATFEGNQEEVKLVLVVRTDLGMTKGKIAAQCSHATLACYKYYMSKAPNSPILKRWERGGQAKIALQVKSEDELLLLQAQAVSLGLCVRAIRDAGRTQIASGSLTVLGILGPRSVVDQVTGHLKLL